MFKRIIAFLVLAAVLAGVLWYSQREEGGLRVSGYVEADEIRVGSRVGGRVARVSAEEGQRVTAGQTLVELEPYVLLEEKARLTAQHEQLAARLDELVHGPRVQEIASARAELDWALAQEQLARLTQGRIEQTFRGGAATQDELARAEQELKASQAVTAQRRQAVELLEAGTRSEEIAQATAALAAAAAELAAIERQIAELTITAPIAGTIEAMELQPGDLIAPNAPALSILATDHLWVRTYIPERRLDIAVGRAVRITFDSYPGETFAGRVTFVARNAEFTPRNVQSSDERARQMFRVKIAIDEGGERLRVGMLGDVLFDED